MPEHKTEKSVDVAWLNTNFPCMMACPVHTNAGRYVGLIAEGRYEDAYRLARDPNPLASICGRVCAHPCESACRRGAIDEPVSIRALKRFLTERHGPESRRPVDVNEGRRSARVPYRVAIIGAGPVGLSAAHDLALLGYSVTIFEASRVAGGMLHLGVPEYRLPRDVVQAQVREILAAGEIELKLNCAAGRDFTVAELQQQGYHAVLLAVGAHSSRDLTIPGVDLKGVYKGIQFLLDVNLGDQLTIGKKVVVIGGGNVAMDVARSAAREVVRQYGNGVEEQRPSVENVKTVAGREMMDVSLSALRMGAQEVHLVCLESRPEMPAASEEIHDAEDEGVLLHPGLGPNRILGRDGRVVGLETLKTKRVFDENHRFSPEFYPDSESVLECDTIIMAIGQAPRLDFLRPEDGVEISRRGLIAVNPETLMTSAPGVFAGGDCAFGPRLIIDSVADGKRAAAGIDRYLRGTTEPEAVVEVEVLKRHTMPRELLDILRQPLPLLPPERRSGMNEVELCMDEASAQREARRCLHCWVNTIFEGSLEDGTLCVLCGGCVDVCPESCLDLVSLDRFDFSAEVVEQLTEREPLLGVELEGVRAAELGKVSGSVMFKDETRCIRCGLCAARCPAGTITMESFNLLPGRPGGMLSIEQIDAPFRESVAIPINAGK
ncbi:MAG: FAD-dependent oxidoreductase [Acidobacteriota bacterium]|nr:FAD-dependent oxidoreductase [Acidobacteriota bacterium]